MEQVTPKIRYSSTHIHSAISQKRTIVCSLDVKILQMINKYVTAESFSQDSPVRVHFQVDLFGPK
jgi:hypothetical protein